jgi:hypothetical protein
MESLELPVFDGKSRRKPGALLQVFKKRKNCLGKDYKNRVTGIPVAGNYSVLLKNLLRGFFNGRSKKAREHLWQKRLSKHCAECVMITAEWRSR